MNVNRGEVVDLCLGELLRKRAETQGDTPFVVGREPLTYEEAHLASSRLANGLASLGISHGDPVVTLLGNGVQLLLAWFATAKLGAVEVPINPAYRGTSLEYLLNHSGARVMFVDEKHLKSLLDIGQKLTALETIVVVGGEMPDEVPWRVVAYEELMAFQPRELLAVDPADLMAVIYTSGTTGHPKGVMESHRCVMQWGCNYVENMELVADDTNYLFPPLFHAMSQFIGVVPALLTGSRIVLGDGFSASRFWDECRQNGVTLFNFTGGVLSFLWKQPERENDRDHPVRRALGVPIPDDLNPGFEERFGVTLLPPFGSSESSVVSYSRPGEVRRGSSGRPIDAFEVRIIDENGHAQPAGQPGEIVTRPVFPDSMMRGYYKQPEVTVNAFRDLWYHTNDMGYLDSDGYLFFVDRKNDAIRRRGENISSFEVERIVDQLGEVLESAAVAVASPYGEQEVKLCVVLRPGAELSPTQIWAHCEREMPAFMVPRFLEFCTSFPKTDTERVRKFELREAGVHEGVLDREKVLQ